MEENKRKKDEDSLADYAGCAFTSGLGLLIYGGIWLTVLFLFMKACNLEI